MKIIAVLFMVVIISSCGNEAKKKTITEPETIIKNADSSVDSISQSEHSDSTAKIILKPGNDTFTEASSVDAREQKIISITIASGQQLFATLHKKNKRFNVRINQIEMPDSTFDGPFGDSLHYKIKMQGVYKIRIGPDLMADGSRNSEFIFKAWVK